MSPTQAIERLKQLNAWLEYSGDSEREEKREHDLYLLLLAAVEKLDTECEFWRSLRAENDITGLETQMRSDAALAALAARVEEMDKPKEPPNA